MKILAFYLTLVLGLNFIVGNAHAEIENCVVPGGASNSHGSNIQLNFADFIAGQLLSENRLQDLCEKQAGTIFISLDYFFPTNPKALTIFESEDFFMELAKQLDELFEKHQYVIITGPPIKSFKDYMVARPELELPENIKTHIEAVTKGMEQVDPHEKGEAFLPKSKFIDAFLNRLSNGTRPEAERFTYVPFDSYIDHFRDETIDLEKFLIDPIHLSEYAYGALYNNVFKEILAKLTVSKKELEPISLKVFNEKLAEILKLMNLTASKAAAFDFKIGKYRLAANPEAFVLPIAEQAKSPSLHFVKRQEALNEYQRNNPAQYELFLKLQKRLSFVSADLKDKKKTHAFPFEIKKLSANEYYIMLDMNAIAYTKKVPLMLESEDEKNMIFTGYASDYWSTVHMVSEETFNRRNWLIRKSKMPHVNYRLQLSYNKQSKKATMGFQIYPALYRDKKSQPIDGSQDVRGAKKSDWQEWWTEEIESDRHPYLEYIFDLE